MTVKVGDQKAKKTSVKEKTLKPLWDETFTFKLETSHDLHHAEVGHSG